MEPTTPKTHAQELIDFDGEVLQAPWGTNQYLRILLRSQDMCPHVIPEIIHMARAIRRLDGDEWVTIAHVIEAGVYVSAGGAAAITEYFHSDNAALILAIGPQAARMEPLSPMAVRVEAIVETLENGHPVGPAVDRWRDQMATFEAARGE